MDGSFRVIQSPIGPLTLYAHSERLAAIDFSDKPMESTLSYLQKRLGDEMAGSDNSEILDAAEQQLAEYFAGKRTAFGLKLSVKTTDFQTLVYGALQLIPYGGVTSYSEIAGSIGYPKACRAVGNANNKNPLPIVIPCHRVNARDGMLSGYAGGTSVKRKLQELEANTLKLQKSTEIVSSGETLNPELTQFIRSFLSQDERLERIVDEANAKNIPISKPETLALLNVLCAMKGAANVLEIGTAVGVSAITLALSNSGCNITTIERDASHSAAARHNIASLGLTDRITLHEGDALDILHNLHGAFDMIYIDAAKSQYGKLFELCKPLVKPSGAIVFDNVLYKGITSGIQTVKHKNRTMVRNLQSFLKTAQSDSGFLSSLIPTGDGVLICVKRGME